MITLNSGKVADMVLEISLGSGDKRICEHTCLVEGQIWQPLYI